MRCEGTIFLGDKAVEIRVEDGKQTSIRTSADLSMEEMEALTCITETLSCLSSGKQLGPYFNPTVNHAYENAVVRCKWSRSGKLVIIGESEKRFLHAETVEECLLRQRTFTTIRSVAKNLPSKRGE